MITMEKKEHTMQRKAHLSLIALAFSLVAFCPNCSKNAVNSGEPRSTEPFLIRLNNIHDSTGYCYQSIHSNSVMCAETLHYNDTAGAVIFSISDTEDRVIITPAPTFNYVQTIAIDSTGCNSVACAYWVRGIQVDAIVKWSALGYVCSFEGNPKVVLTFLKMTKVAIGYPNDTVTVDYRDSISTTAGATRNNLMSITHSGIDMQSMAITALMTPIGINISHFADLLPTFCCNKKLGQSYFKIQVSSSIAPGEYAFEFSVKIDGREYGKIPCTVKVVE
jgi:hypothetical protein